LLEPILGPLWVWALLGEHPGTTALVGGAFVLCAVIANEAIAARRGRGVGAQRRCRGLELTPRDGASGGFRAVAL
jgi:hypothetical protein